MVTLLTRRWLQHGTKSSHRVNKEALAFSHSPPTGSGVIKEPGLTDEIEFSTGIDYICLPQRFDLIVPCFELTPKISFMSHLAWQGLRHALHMGRCHFISILVHVFASTNGAAGTDSFFNASFFLHVGVYINAGGVTDALAAFRRLPFLVRVCASPPSSRQKD